MTHIKTSVIVASAMAVLGGAFMTSTLPAQAQVPADCTDGKSKPHQDSAGRIVGYHNCQTSRVRLHVTTQLPDGSQTVLTPCVAGRTLQTWPGKAVSLMIGDRC